MKEIAIVTDSTADIPEELIKNYDIKIAPLYIHTQGKEYRDKINITNKEIYRLLENNIEVKTSAPSPKDFIELYSEIIIKQDAKTIYSIHISSKLSNTVDSAKLARNNFPDTAIEIFDSRTVSLSLGLIVLETVKAIRNQESSGNINHESIKNLINFLIEKTLFLATVENFEYLLRGGRVSGLKKLLNYMLKVKPVFVTDEGKVKVFKVCRTRSGSVGTIIQEFKNRYSNKGKVRAGIFYGNDLDTALKVKQDLMQDKTIDIEEILFSEITPVIGTHSGPSIIGLSAVPVF